MNEKPKVPEQPWLEQRVARLEEDMKDVRTVLGRVEQRLDSIDAELRHLPKASDYAAIATAVARMEGKLSQSPTFLQLIVAIITTWAAGAAIVAALLRFSGS